VLVGRASCAQSLKKGDVLREGAYHDEGTEVKYSKAIQAAREKGFLHGGTVKLKGKQFAA